MINNIVKIRIYIKLGRQYSYVLNLILTSFFCLIINFSSCCLAQNLDDNIDVDSDDLTINQQNHTVKFSGKVKVKFDTIELNTDLIIVYYIDSTNKNSVAKGGNKTIDKIEIPHKLTAFDNCLDRTVIANSGFYDGQSRKLILTGDVRANDQNKLLIAKKLIYTISSK